MARNGEEFVKLINDGKDALYAVFKNGSLLSYKIYPYSVVAGGGLTPEEQNKLNNAVTKDEFNNHALKKNNPHDTKIGNLADTAITGLLGGHVLVYNSSTGKWENKKVAIDESGKIRIEQGSDLVYLSDIIDNSTLKIKDNKLVVTTIDGLLVSVAEINNMKTKIDSIASGGMTFNGTVATKADLLALTGLLSGDTRIVLADESNESKRMTYIFDGIHWQPLGEFSLRLRDFTTDPLDLASEVKGVLPEDKMDLSKVAKKSDLTGLLDKETYDTNKNGIVDKAETLEGLNRSVDEINKLLTPNEIIAGDNIEITDNNDGTIEIKALTSGEFKPMTTEEVTQLAEEVLDNIRITV